MYCRHCQTKLKEIFLNLGFAPPSNAYLNEDDLSKPEIYFPLKLYVCEKCKLVQTEDYAKSEELFKADYAYFSSTSSLWLKHAKNYCKMITEKLKLNKNSFVIEVASNDGYLLKNFVKADIPCLGIEPTKDTANAARLLGIDVIEEFFGEKFAEKLSKTKGKADLIIGNNVYAHVPDINDFTAGFKAILKKEGTITIEFPHLLNLIKYNQFDTVYHEHYSYYSLFTVCQIFETAGLKVYDVEKLPTHGGSLRVYGCHKESLKEASKAVINCLEEEKEFGLEDLKIYKNFQARANKVKNDFLSFLLEEKKKGKHIVGYGAAAKGNTLLNYAGVKTDLIDYVCDAAKAKQNKFLPGSHIQILSPDKIKQTKPDYVIIFPWNIKNEVMQQLSYIKEWGGKFVTFVPSIEVV